ncbi:MAG: peptidase [Conexibacter sp.]|nr:peptidase [Conexibacter sp.]
MTWILAFLGFAALIILHEAGHFAAAKAVGMRVERFSLFFGRPLVSFHRGETEYGIGWAPLGGYVRITGMNPREEIPPEVEHRAYYRQPVWKRIVVIAAGPAVNIVLAFLILWAVFATSHQYTATDRVASQQLLAPASQYLQPGDRIVGVDGVRGDSAAIARQVSSHRCAGMPTNGCVASTPAHVVVSRAGKQVAFDIRPHYDATKGIARTRLGFTYAVDGHIPSIGGAARDSVDKMWQVTTGTVSVFAHIFQAKERKQLSGIVGSYEATRQSISSSAAQAFGILGLISLSLAVINLFPFLPLDGGHIFWAVVEKLRGRAVPFALMERASIVGIALVLMLFVVGLSNDIGRIQDGTLGLGR